MAGFPRNPNPPDFRALFESAPGLYLVLKTDLSIVAVSDAYLEATMTKRESILGRGIFDVFPDNPDDSQADGVRNLRASLLRVLKNKTTDNMPLQKYDIRRPEAQGGGYEERYWSPMNSPVFGEGEELAYIIHRVEDVTEFVRLQQLGTEQEKLTAELRQKADRMAAEVYERARQLEEANRRRLESVGRLAGGVAHDFNNMLGVIMGCAEMMEGQFAEPDKLQHGLKQIRQATESAASLTRQLLAYSRQQVLLPQVLNLNAVIEKTEPLLRRVIGEHIAIQTNLDPSLENIKADEGQIEQVIMNLALNARDAMPEGGRLVLETANLVSGAEGAPASHLSPGEYAMVAVSDTGAGMDSALQERIFEPFFTTKSKGKGTGLGLASVYGVVKQSGGHIWVRSEPGKGSTFTFCLPKTAELPPRAARDAWRPQTRSGFETILLVEDEETLRDILREMLETEKYRVLCAESPAKALEIAHAHVGRVDLLLTDIVMPGMSGKTLAEKFDSVRPGTKVVFMSGYTENVALEGTQAQQTVAFLQKPFTRKALVEKVRELLRRS
jgi:signal transduction histidine kinase